MEWDKKLNDEKFLKDIREEASKASEQLYKNSDIYRGNMFDTNALDNADSDILQKLREEMDKYKKKCLENFELHCICEIAIHYIDILLKDKKNE